MKVKVKGKGAVNGEQQEGRGLGRYIACEARTTATAVATTTGHIPIRCVKM